MWRRQSQLPKSSWQLRRRPRCPQHAEHPPCRHPLAKVLPTRPLGLSRDMLLHVLHPESIKSAETTLPICPAFHRAPSGVEVGAAPLQCPGRHC